MRLMQSLKPRSIDIQLDDDRVIVIELIRPLSLDLDYNRDLVHGAYNRYWYVEYRVLRLLKSCYEEDLQK